MKMWSKIGGVAVAFACLVACLFSSIEFHAFNKSYYEKKYTSLHTAASIGMSDEALFAATDALLDYIKDKRDDISCVQQVHEKQREVFDERERAHMVDVKALYLNVRAVCFFLVGIGVAALCGLLLAVKKQKCTHIQILEDIQQGFRQVVCAFVIVVGGLLFYALVDFNRFWTVFHQIFFRNDLWLLDPRVSIMINMFPEEFFFGMVIRIALTFIFSFVLIVVCFHAVKRRHMKNMM